MRTTASDERADVLKALEDHVERPVRPQEIVATESQLFKGYLIIEGQECHFLCARYGGWSVHSSFPAAKVTGLEAMPSFVSDDYEVRALVDGKLYRFGGLDRAAADQLVQVIALVGGEPAGKRSTRHAPVARKRLEFSAALTARPSYAMHEGDAESVAGLSPGPARPTPPRRGPPSQPFAASPSSPPPAGFGFSKPASRGFAVSAVSVADDDDDDDDDDDYRGHDDEHEECDDPFEFPDDDDDDDDDDELDDDEFQALLNGMERATAEAKTATAKKSSAAKPETTIRPFVRGIAAAFVYVVLANIVGSGVFDDVTDELMREPEIAPYVWPAIGWSILALPGGFTSMSFGRTVMMAFAGVGAGVVVTSLFMNAPTIPVTVVGLLGWLIIGWVAVLSRGGGSALLKAGAITAAISLFGADTSFDMLAIGGAVQCGIFWLMHAFLERYELNAAAKKAAA